jgi:hypothetical protein
MTISKKGINQFSIDSFHYFIITTNKENPIGTTKDDRRKIIIRSSDELIRNKEYFDKIYEMVEDTDVIRTCYDYFKDYDLSEYDYKNIPTTEHQDDLKQLSVSCPEQWLEFLTRENIHLETVEMLGKDIFINFSAWAVINNIKYDTTALKLDIALKNLKIDGLEKGRHTDEGATKMFNIVKLKKYFNMGCLVKY